MYAWAIQSNNQPTSKHYLAKKTFLTKEFSVIVCYVQLNMIILVKKIWPNNGMLIFALDDPTPGMNMGSLT